MRTSLMILSVLSLSLSAQAAKVVAQLPDEIIVQSTAIQAGDVQKACESKSSDTEKLIAKVVAAHPDLQGLIVQKSYVDKGDVTNDCFYKGVGIGILCSPTYTTDACYTEISIFSNHYKLVYNGNDTDEVYNENDRGDLTSVSVEAK